MAHEWLAEGEEIVGTWPVYIGGEGPTAAKVTGKLHVTSRNVCFEGQLELDEGAAAAVSNRIQAFRRSATLITIPFDQIAGAVVTKRLLILKSLHIRLKTGDELVVRFGAASPAAALEAITSRLG